MERIRFDEETARYWIGNRPIEDGDKLRIRGPHPVTGKPCELEVKAHFESAERQEDELRLGDGWVGPPTDFEAEFEKPSPKRSRDLER